MNTQHIISEETDQLITKTSNMKTNFNNPKGLYIARPKDSAAPKEHIEDRLAENKAKGKAYIAYPKSQVTVQEAETTNFPVLLQEGLFVAFPKPTATAQTKLLAVKGRLRLFNRNSNSALPSLAGSNVERYRNYRLKRRANPVTNLLQMFRLKVS